MPVMFWGAGGAVLVALFAAFRERRRRLRDDPDRVGWVDWRTVQLAAVLATILLVSVGLHTG
jgi:hypothetical protein